MAKRILPYRDYSEHDVVNLFSLDTSAYTIADAKSNAAAGSAFDSGVVVSVSAGELPGEVSELRAKSTDDLRDYLGASFDGAHIGFNAYPENGMTVAPAAAGSRGLGITLRETLAYDENGEKLLYYKQKLDEAQAVLPGQTVPVLTRGLVLLTAGTGGAIPGGATVGHDLVVGANGTLVDDDPSSPSGNPIVGKVIAEGYEVKKGAKGSSVAKLLCQISF